MYRTIIKIEDMACAMCEAHIKEAIRREFERENRLKKVAANSIKGRAEIVSEKPIDEQRLKTTVKNAGYTAGDVFSEQVEKTIFGYKKV